MQPTGRLHAELFIYNLSRTRTRDEVYSAIGRRGPVSTARVADYLCGRVHRSTVYRTVKTFISARIVHELAGGLIELSPPYRQLHYFILCTVAAVVADSGMRLSSIN